MSQYKQTPPGSEDQPEGKGEGGEGHFLLNAGQTVFLVAVLFAAWFFMEWLMGRWAGWEK
jgi:hypothetical protein